MSQARVGGCRGLHSAVGGGGGVWSQISKPVTPSGRISIKLLCPLLPRISHPPHFFPLLLKMTVSLRLTADVSVRGAGWVWRGGLGGGNGT